MKIIWFIVFLTSGLQWMKFSWDIIFSVTILATIVFAFLINYIGFVIEYRSGKMKENDYKNNKFMLTSLSVFAYMMCSFFMNLNAWYYYWDVSYSYYIKLYFPILLMIQANISWNYYENNRGNNKNVV